MSQWLRVASDWVLGIWHPSVPRAVAYVQRMLRYPMAALSIFTDRMVRFMYSVFYFLLLQGINSVLYMILPLISFGGFSPIHPSHLHLGFYRFCHPHIHPLASIYNTLPLPTPNCSVQLNPIPLPPTPMAGCTPIPFFPLAIPTSPYSPVSPLSAIFLYSSIPLFLYFFIPLLSFLNYISFLLFPYSPSLLSSSLDRIQSLSIPSPSPFSPHLLSFTLNSPPPPLFFFPSSCFISSLNPLISSLSSHLSHPPSLNPQPLPIPYFHPFSKNPAQFKDRYSRTVLTTPTREQCRLRLLENSADYAYSRTVPIYPVLK